MDFAASFEHTANPNLFLEEVLEYLMGYYDPSPILLADLKNILLSGQATDSYWTNAWINYVSDPNNQTNISIVENRLKGLFQKILQLPEFHLH